MSNGTEKKIICLKYLGVPWQDFSLERLVGLLINKNWQQQCVIIPAYLSPNADKHDRPQCVIKWVGKRFYDAEEESRYLRYSAGPAQGYFWDIYGEDFLYPELALIALQTAPSPHTWKVEGR